MGRQFQLLSVITPAYNEEENLPILYALLAESLSSIGMEWEWIIVDDHSDDKTFQIASRLAHSNQRIRVFRLSRNFGSHVAIRCGLSNAHGACAVVMAADLQDPPAVVTRLLQSWHQGVKIVWAVRQNQKKGPFLAKVCSRFYYLILRKFIGLKEIPATGADFFLIDRKLIDILLKFEEKNTSIFALLAGLGFRQEHLVYEKQSRLRGHSGWTLRKKIKLTIDSIISYSYAPIRAFCVTGFFTAFFGFIYATIILFKKFFGTTPVQGWTSLMIVLLIIGGLQMIMLGILGEYLWRTLEQSRRRPIYLIEEEINNRIPNEILKECK